MHVAIRDQMLLVEGAYLVQPTPPQLYRALQAARYIIAAARIRADRSDASDPAVYVAALVVPQNSDLLTPLGASFFYSVNWKYALIRRGHLQPGPQALWDVLVERGYTPSIHSFPVDDVPHTMQLGIKI